MKDSLLDLCLKETSANDGFTYLAILFLILNGNGNRMHTFSQNCISSYTYTCKLKHKKTGIASTITVALNINVTG